MAYWVVSLGILDLLYVSYGDLIMHKVLSIFQKASAMLVTRLLLFHELFDDPILFAQHYGLHGRVEEIGL